MAITTVRPASRFGIVERDPDGTVVCMLNGVTTLDIQNVDAPHAALGLYPMLTQAFAGLEL